MDDERRLVALAALGDLRERRAIGLDEEAVARHERHGLADWLGGLVRDDAGERDVAAHLGVRARVVWRSGETMNHAAELGGAAGAQDVARVFVGVADMADDGL